MYPRPGSNRHAFKGQGILSPSCLPIPPLRHLHKKSRLPSGPSGAENETRTRDPDLGKVVLYQLSYFRFANCAAKVQLFSIPQAILRKNFHFSFFNTNFSEKQFMSNSWYIHGNSCPRKKTGNFFSKMFAELKKVVLLHRNSQAEIAQLVEHDLAKVGVASSSLVFRSAFAEIAQLVEHDLAKVGVASSSLVFRSRRSRWKSGFFV